MNKYVKSDNQNGYTNLKLAVGGAFYNVVSTGENAELHHICPSVVVDFLHSKKISYNRTFIVKGRGQYNVRFDIFHPTPIEIEIDTISGNTNIKRI